MATAKDKHTVHWFRKGLRLHDNPSLKEGLETATTFRCVFIIDPWFAGSSNVGINKWRFLLQCLEDLDASLKKLNSRLFVVRGQPADALPKLFKEWGTTSLTFEEDPEPFGRVRDHNIMTMCREIGIDVVSKVSHTLYKLDTIIEKNGGKAPLTYQQFQTVIAGMEAPSAAETTLTPTNIGNATTPVSDDHDEKYGVPTLEELGFDTERVLPPVWVGGESEALARLERHLERKAWVASFGRPKMTPQSLLASKTGLSPYLRFGCLSTRLFYYQLTDLYKKIKRSRPPLSLHGQLLWREFFYCAATKNPNFDKMLGNPICVQIPWDKNSEALAKWANGQTGFPWIDAIMIQLREEGWIHHLARHAVACFLTRGDLWISWEEGMKVFEELLLDADWSVNAGTWMWLSCSSFFQQFFHCYCPVRFGRKADPHGDYIRKYIPKLKNFPTQYIHAPWLAPQEVQKNANCMIGEDYPLPMVDHGTAARANIQRIKQVYRKLAKYKTNDESNKGNSLLQSMIINNINQSNMPPTSPSPNTIITNVNHSNFLCNTTSDNQNLENMFQQNQSVDDQNSPSTNSTYVKNYEDTDTTVVSDIFDNQQRNNTNLQICNMPFKKIVVIEQNYDDIKQEQKNEDKNNKTGSYSNENHNFGETMNVNYQKPNFYVDQNETYENSDFIENNHNYYMNRSQTNQSSETKYPDANNETQVPQSIPYDISVTSQPFDVNNYNKLEPLKSSTNLNTNYKLTYSNCEMKQTNTDGEISIDTVGLYNQLSQISSSYNNQQINNEPSSYTNQSVNAYSNDVQYNIPNENTNQGNDLFQIKNLDDLNIDAYNSTNDPKNHDCSHEEEQARFQQGKTVGMQECNWTNI